MSNTYKGNIIFLLIIFLMLFVLSCEQEDSPDMYSLSGNYIGSVWKNNVRYGSAEIRVDMVDDAGNGVFSCFVYNSSDLFLFGYGTVFRPKDVPVCHEFAGNLNGYWRGKYSSTNSINIIGHFNYHHPRPWMIGDIELNLHEILAIECGKER